MFWMSDVWMCQTSPTPNPQVTWMSIVRRLLFVIYRFCRSTRVGIGTQQAFVHGPPRSSFCVNNEIQEFVLSGLKNRQQSNDLTWDSIWRGGGSIVNQGPTLQVTSWVSSQGSSFPQPNLIKRSKFLAQGGSCSSSSSLQVLLVCKGEDWIPPGFPTRSSTKCPSLLHNTTIRSQVNYEHTSSSAPHPIKLFTCLEKIGSLIFSCFITTPPCFFVLHHDTTLYVLCLYHLLASQASYLMIVLSWHFLIFSIFFPSISFLFFPDGGEFLKWARARLSLSPLCEKKFRINLHMLPSLANI